MIFLHSHGVSTSRAVRIFKTYGADAIQVMSENPYRLARDIRGIGFKTADTIAARLGIEKTAMIRARAGIGFALTEAMDDGHCGLPLERAGADGRAAAGDASRDHREALDLELEAGEVDRRRGRRSSAASSWPACIGPSAPSPGVFEAFDRVCCPGQHVDAGKGHPMGRSQDRHHARRQPARRRSGWPCSPRSWSSPAAPGSARRRWSTRSSRCSPSKGVEIALAAPTGRAAKRLQREHRPRGEDDPSPARGRSEDGRLQAQRGEPADVRPARRRRDVDGRRAADARAPAGGARSRGADPGRRRRPAAVGRPRPGARRHHRLGCGAGGAADRDLPPGGREPDHRQRPPHQPGADAGLGAGPGRATSTSCRMPRSRGWRRQDRGDRPRAHPGALRPRPDPRHPGAVPDEPRRPRRQVAQPRAAAGRSTRRASDASSASAGPSASATR